MESLDDARFPIIFNKIQIFPKENNMSNILKVSIDDWLVLARWLIGWLVGWLVGSVCRFDTTYDTYIKR